MTAATAPPADVAAYLAAVRAALGDLPPAERDDLLAEVEASLVDAANETDAPIGARLGPPDKFAAELRAAAGLQGSAPTAESRLVSLARAGLAATAPARRVLVELAPIWWVVRAWVAVGVVALVSDAGWSWRHPVLPRFAPGGIEDPLLSVLVFGAAIAASVGIGLRSRRWTRGKPALVAANIALLLLAVPVLTNVPASHAGITVVEAEPVPGLVYNGAVVQNLYPYSRDGRLLHDILLFDSYGHPVEIGAGTDDPERRLLRTADGTVIYNSFPIRYYEPGTRHVARPNAGPRVETPRLVTPPLRAKRR